MDLVLNVKKRSHRTQSPMAFQFSPKVFSANPLDFLCPMVRLLLHMVEIIPDFQNLSNSHTYESRYETDIDLTLKQNQLTKRVKISKLEARIQGLHFALRHELL